MDKQGLDQLLKICDYLALDSIKLACERQLAFDFVSVKMENDTTKEMLENIVSSAANDIQSFFDDEDINIEIAVLICSKYIDNAIKKLKIDLAHPEKLSERIRYYRKRIN